MSPIITSGGLGGSLPPEWTVDSAGDVEIAPTDNTANYLTSVKAPAGFLANSPAGTMLRLTDENGNVIFEFAVEADLNITAQAGLFGSIINLKSVDFPTSHINFNSGGDGGSPYILCKYQDALVFEVGPFGEFQVHTASDVIAFSVENHANATSQTLLVNAASGQTGNLIEVDVLPDGNPGFVVGPSGEIETPLLPTADPHVAGQMWNSSGVVHVSAG